jgi:hypothetical protein
MARQTRAQLNTANASLFVTGGEVTAPEEKTYNQNLNESLQFLDPASTKAALEIVRAASGLTVDQWYKITDGTASNDKVIAIQASAVNAFYTVAENLTDGTFGTYSGDVFLANITLQEYRAGTTPHSGAPTVTDDSDSFYAVGSSRWIDTTTQVEWLCTDATVGAAVWQAQQSEYTPTVSHETNVSASAPKVCQTIINGNMQTNSGHINIDPTAPGPVEFWIDLNSITGSFVDTDNVSGILTTSAGEAGTVQAINGANQAVFTYTSLGANAVVYFTLTFKILPP